MRTGEREDLRRYAYLRVVGSENQRFDPAVITRSTGIEPAESWRLGDPHPRIPGNFRTFDLWEIESSLGRGADLDRQVDSLFANSEAWPALVKAISPHNPLLGFVVYTERDPVEFTIRREIIDRVLELKGEIDCDLYWVCNQRIIGGHCENCRIAVPTTMAVLRHHIGGQQRVAECQAKLTLYDVEADDAARAFGPDVDKDAVRIGDNADVCYLPDLRCVQFSSDFLPAAPIPPLEPERLASAFLTAVKPYSSRVRPGRSEFSVNLVERGNFQGTVGLHFDTGVLKQLWELDTALTVQLRYVPEPYFKSDGNCFHCAIDALRLPKDGG